MIDLLFSALLQTNEFTVIDGTNGAVASAADPDFLIRVNTSVHNGQYRYSVEVLDQKKQETQIRLSSDAFNVLESFRACDQLVLSVLEKMTGNKYLFGSIKINDGTLPENIRVYLNGREVNANVLNRIITGTHEIRIDKVDDAQGKKTLFISPVVVEDDKETSIQIDADEIIAPLTKRNYVSSYELESYSYWSEDWKLAGKRSVLLFTAQGVKDVTVALSRKPRTESPMYEFCIGGWDNTKTVLRKYTGEIPVCRIANPPPDIDAIRNKATVKRINIGINFSPKKYWILVDHKAKEISMGTGNIPGKNMWIRYTDNELTTEPLYFSFSSWNNEVAYSEIRTEMLEE